MLVRYRAVTKSTPQANTVIQISGHHYVSFPSIGELSCSDDAAANLLSTTRLPQNLDITSRQSQVKVKISAKEQSQPISPAKLASSALFQELQRFLLRNLGPMGITAVNGPVRESDGIFLYLTPSGMHDARDACRENPPVAYLEWLHMEIVVPHIKPAGHEDRYRLFISRHRISAALTSIGTARKLRDPTRPDSNVTQVPLSSTDPSITSELFNDEVDHLDILLWRDLLARFCVAQIVRRYPQIFGQWKLHKEHESVFFTSIAHSLTNIVLRSENPSLKLQARKSSKAVAAQRARHANAAWDALGSLQLGKRGNTVDNQYVAVDAMQLKITRGGLPSNLLPVMIAADDTEGEENRQRADLRHEIDCALGTAYANLVPSGRKVKFITSNPDEEYRQAPPLTENPEDIRQGGISDENKEGGSTSPPPSPSPSMIGYSGLVSHHTAPSGLWPHTLGYRHPASADSLFTKIDHQNNLESENNDMDDESEPSSSYSSNDGETSDLVDSPQACRIREHPGYHLFQAPGFYREPHWDVDFDIEDDALDECHLKLPGSHLPTGTAASYRASSPSDLQLTDQDCTTGPRYPSIEEEAIGRTYSDADSEGLRPRGQASSFSSLPVLYSLRNANNSAHSQDSDPDLGCENESEQPLDDDAMEMEDTRFWNEPDDVPEHDLPRDDPDGSALEMDI